MPSRGPPPSRPNICRPLCQLKGLLRNCFRSWDEFAQIIIVNTSAENVLAEMKLLIDQEKICHKWICWLIAI